MRRTTNGGSGASRPRPGGEQSAGEGCPIESRDGLSLYIASTRIAGAGNDIFASDRASKSEPFGELQHLDTPVNSDFNGFCPTPIFGSYLLFVSERPGPDTCNAGLGRGDMYIIRRNAAFGWSEPRNLGCVERHRAEQRRGRVQSVARHDGARDLSLFLEHRHWQSRHLSESDAKRRHIRAAHPGRRSQHGVR